MPTALFSHQLCVLWTVRLFPAASKLIILCCFPYLLSRNFRVVELLSLRTRELGETFFTPTAQKALSGSVSGAVCFAGSQRFCHLSDSSPFFPQYCKALLSRSHTMEQHNTTQSSAWHSKFKTPVVLVLVLLFLFFWLERLSYRFSPNFSQKSFFERRGFYCSVKFLNFNEKSLDFIWFCS